MNASTTEETSSLRFMLMMAFSFHHHQPTNKIRCFFHSVIFVSLSDKHITDVINDLKRQKLDIEDQDDLKDHLGANVRKNGRKYNSDIMIEILLRVKIFSDGRGW